MYGDVGISKKQVKNLTYQSSVFSEAEGGGSPVQSYDRDADGEVGYDFSFS